MVGRTLSHYKILSEISRGGMGIVYRALDVKLDREVALKVLPPELVADPERKRRFVQEAKAAAKLEHPHIGVVHEIDEVEGTTFIAMELIRGEQLRDTLGRGSIPLRRALEIATDIAEGLAKAHDERIVHRDLKPANVMVTEDGHTKIIDFGLAKLVEPLSGEGSDIETLTRGTDPGKVMGTVSYMSPEQARGEKVDHRSDIFSFGIVLHEMLTGKLPFHGPSAPETLSAIINASTPELGLPANKEMEPELQRVLDKCLAKEPEERYQTIKDVVVDMRAARKRLDSGPQELAVTAMRRKPLLYIAGAAVIAFLMVGAFLLFQPEPEETPTTLTTKPSIAVLLFENINKDPELDWMRLGLAEMLVTDLSQSPHMEVVPTDRIYRILGELDSLDESVSSLEIVQEVAERANVETVLLGSYMKAGETIRINIRIQEAGTDKILGTEKVEAVGESDIFSKVDELTRQIRASFDVPAAAGVPSLEEVTTSSSEAYRYYAEARKLRNEQRNEEAIPLLKKAIDLDPNFATAIHNLASAHWNMGHDKQAEVITKQALKLEQLPDRERYLLEARLYSLHEEDYGQAIEAYRRLRDLDVSSGWNNAAFRYHILERYDKAIELMEEYLLRQGGRFSNVAHYETFSDALISQGKYEQAYKLLQRRMADSPGSAETHRLRGDIFVMWGKLEDAVQAYDKAESILGTDLKIQNRRWWVYMLRGQWENADTVIKKLTESAEIRNKGRGWTYHALLSLHRGSSETALVSLSRLGEAAKEHDRITGLSHSLAGHILLERGQLKKAIEHAKEAQQKGRGDIAEWEGLFFEALAEAKLGRLEVANEVAGRLGERTKSIPSEKERRRRHHLLGEMGRLRGDWAVAIETLETAKSMLPPHAHGAQHYSRTGAQPHVPIWYSLASAYLEAGDEEKAEECFQRITLATVENVEWPIPYVRSFYFLGKIHENRGEMEKAREYYRRFYEYWKDGDMDRERVEEVKRKIS